MCIRGVTNSDGVSCYNRCFLNSIVQFLRVCPDFVGLVQSMAAQIDGEGFVGSTQPSLYATEQETDRRLQLYDFFCRLAEVLKVRLTQPHTLAFTFSHKARGRVGRPRAS